MMRSFTLLLIIFLITACGGSGGSNDASHSQDDEPVSQTLLDSDGDGIPDESDADDDNDGVVDGDDAFPLDASEQYDTDNDGVGNNADSDDDNDGVADDQDAFPLDASEQLDSDGDGIGNNADADDDNDGVNDSNDAFPLDPAEHRDSDKDGIGDNSDPDDDNDGLDDSRDQWPLDESRPVFSSLWGVDGELWTPQSRLPLVVFAGYREGKEELPEPTRIVANVLDFGATNTSGSEDDTQSFLDAIDAARDLVSAENPGVIFIPAGVYQVSKQLHLNQSGLILRGAGRDESVIEFTRGLINDANAIGSDAKRRKLIVMGGNYDANNKLRSGVQWEQWNADFSATLDLNNLPSRGDFVVRLKEPLKPAFKDRIIAQNNRIRISQAMNYGETSDTPELAAHIYGGPAFAAPGASGGIWVTQQLVVSIHEDDQTLQLDRPLRFTPTSESRYGGARIAVKDTQSAWATEEIGVEHLTIQLPSTDWVDHFGTEGQGGIEVMADNSWVRNVKLINADNGIEVDKGTFNNTLKDIVIAGDRTPRRSGPSSRRYDAYGHHGLTLKGREHLLEDFVLEVSYVHDVTMNNCHGCVVTHGQAPQMNMDHHRQGIYASVWTELNLGIPHRMWESTGNPSEGFNASAYNTYWNIISDDPAKAYWPEDGNNYPQWGYHWINIVALDIDRKPDADEGNRPFPYHPDNAHLEVIQQAEVWPQNIYEAQLDAYKKGGLW